MPSNCSSDVEAVVSYFDATLSGDNQTAIDELKALYGMEGLEHSDDVAGACAYLLLLFLHPTYFVTRTD